MPERLSRARQSTDPTPPRPTRWPAAVAALVDLQEEYRTWLENLPQNLESSKLASKLQTIIELDLEELQAIDPAATAGTDAAKALAPDLIRGSVWRGRPRSGDGAAACGFSMRIILRFRCELRADYACDFRCELGESGPALRRVAEYGDGWIGFNLLPDQAAEKINGSKNCSGPMAASRVAVHQSDQDRRFEALS
jgi:hypothetical protein